jgi:hypothetical protein
MCQWKILLNQSNYLAPIGFPYSDHGKHAGTKTMQRFGNLELGKLNSEINRLEQLIAQGKATDQQRRDLIEMKQAYDKRQEAVRERTAR